MLEFMVLEHQKLGHMLYNELKILLGNLFDIHVCVEFQCMHTNMFSTTCRCPAHIHLAGMMVMTEHVENVENEKHMDTFDQAFVCQSGNTKKHVLEASAVLQSVWPQHVKPEFRVMLSAYACVAHIGSL